MSDEHPSSDPEFYFRRVWNPAAPHPDDEVVVMNRAGGDFQVWIGRRRDIPEQAQGEGVPVPMASEPLVIYGRKIDSRYPEDQEYLRLLETQDCIFTESFSVAAPTGEIGSHPVRELEEISREEFEAARERGWTD
jgi:hypothetical protein